MASAEKFFSEEQKEAIRNAIADAEKMTSGEIRVHIEPRCSGQPLQRAEAVFAGLKMQETEERNGVLFYLAVETRVFAIFADKGIYERAPRDLWSVISAEMEGKFRQGDFTGGLTEGIRKAGATLRNYFPLGKNDKNELQDEISFQ